MEKELLNLLLELREKYCARALKIELGSEFLNSDEIVFLKKLSDKANLDFNIKVSGSEDERGIELSGKQGAKNIIVPMVESKYALEKFLRLSKKHNLKSDIFVNIETISAFRVLDDIISQNIKGVIFGRSDMAYSLGLSCQNVDDTELFRYAQVLSLKLHKKNLQYYIGGRVSEKSTRFFKDLPYLSGFETRKIVFDKKALLTQGSINKALEFELMWLKSKKQTQSDLDRIKLIEKRI